jgi:serine/threonine protein kinase
MDSKVLKVIGEYSITNRRIGKGAFSSVYEGFHRHTLDAVAVKVCRKSSLSPKLLASLDLEISILEELDHPNVVQLLMVHVRSQPSSNESYHHHHQLTLFF